MSSDPNVEKMARLLETGATMLADPCSTCGAPLFRYRGDIICPVCSDAVSGGAPSAKDDKRPVAVSAMKPAVRKQESSPAAPARSLGSTRPFRNDTVPPESAPDYGRVRAHVMSGSAQDLRDLLLLKVASLADDIQNEKDPRRISEYFDLIDKGLSLIEKMNEM